MGVIILGFGKEWTQEQIEFLSDNWGYKPVPWIAEKLSRPFNGVILKAKRLELGACTSAGELMTARAVSNLMSVDIHTVTDYWIPKGLKAQKKAMRAVKKMTMINFNDLLKWLKKNQDKWDSRRVELFVLGGEPDWLKAKRKLDEKNTLKGCIKWSPVEDQTAIALFKQGFTIQQIADRISRTHSGVEHRISRLDVWGSGKYIGNQKQEKSENLKRLQSLTKLSTILLFRRNQLAFDGFWQKSICMNWDDFKGCKVNENDCDSCTSFIRIREQYCRRCGATFLKRQQSDMCDNCKAAKKKQAQRKWAVLNARH